MVTPTISGKVTGCSLRLAHLAFGFLRPPSPGGQGKGDFFPIGATYEFFFKWVGVWFVVSFRLSLAAWERCNVNAFCLLGTRCGSSGDLAPVISGDCFEISYYFLFSSWLAFALPSYPVVVVTGPGFVPRGSPKVRWRVGWAACR